MSEIADYLRRALQDLASTGPGARVLDFGCGRGALVADLNAMGFTALGCDKDPYWQNDQGGQLRPIEEKPYRLPYEDASFDAVVSTSVMEHAQNKEECFREIHRVLRPGGVSMHFMPVRWYLPIEPHIYVPLVNFMWPRVPRTWLALWAIAGVRNEFQTGKAWREVVELNTAYCRTGLSYWSAGAYEAMSMKIFGNIEWPMEHFIAHSGGGYNRLVRKLPGRAFWGYVGRHLRTAFMMHRKAA